MTGENDAAGRCHPAAAVANFLKETSHLQWVHKLMMPHPLALYQRLLCLHKSLQSVLEPLAEYNQRLFAGNLSREQVSWIHRWLVWEYLCTAHQRHSGDDNNQASAKTPLSRAVTAHPGDRWDAAASSHDRMLTVMSPACHRHGVCLRLRAAVRR